jgi:hypothetical protein
MTTKNDIDVIAFIKSARLRGLPRPMGFHQSGGQVASVRNNHHSAPYAFDVGTRTR